MTTRTITAATLALALGMVLDASAYNIALKVSSPQRIFEDASVGAPATGTRVPIGCYYQIWWSPDQSYSSTELAPGQISEGVAQAAQGFNVNGDYVLWNGLTTVTGGFSGSPDINSANAFTTANTGGAQPSGGFVYGYLYGTTFGGTTVDGTPNAGDQYARSIIYGPSPTSFGLDGSGNQIQWPNAANGDPSVTINFNSPSYLAAGTQNILSQSQLVVPEPGTLALLGLGMLTLASRRRRIK